jgi:hypothetical protein
LYDGIATGRHVLEQLGLKVGAYFSSEVTEGETHVIKERYPDVQLIGAIDSLTPKKIAALAPVDLVIGGISFDEPTPAELKDKTILDGHMTSFQRFYNFLSLVHTLNRQHAFF